MKDKPVAKPQAGVTGNASTAVLVAAILVGVPVAQAQWSLTGLGWLDSPGHPDYDMRNSQAWGVSGDGFTVVGQSSSDLSGTLEAFRWTSTGMVGLGDLPGGQAYSYAKSVNYDGTLIAGLAAGSANHAAVYSTTSSSWTDLGALGTFPDFRPSEAFAISNDGGTVVGNSGGFSTGQAFSYTWPGGAMVGLGGTAAYGVALTGAGNTNIVGATKVVVDGNTVTHAFRSVNSGSLEDLGTLGGTYSQANDISVDGGWIVGASTSAGAGNTDQEAFLSNGPIQLGDGLGDIGQNDGVNDDLSSEALAVSRDGKVVVGWGRDETPGLNSPTDAVVWFPETGETHVLYDYLVDNGVNLSGWQRLTQATGVSDDGTVISGYGEYVDPVDGLHTQGFVATIVVPALIPEPSTLGLASALGLLGLVAWRRRARSADRRS